MEYSNELKEAAKAILDDPFYLEDLFVIGDKKILLFEEVKGETNQDGERVAVMMRTVPMPAGDIHKTVFAFATVMMRYHQVGKITFAWKWVMLLPDVKGWVGACMINEGLDPDKWYWVTVKDAPHD